MEESTLRWPTDKEREEMEEVREKIEREKYTAMVLIATVFLAICHISVMLFALCDYVLLYTVPQRCHLNFYNLDRPEPIFIILCMQYPENPRF